MTVLYISCSNKKDTFRDGRGFQYRICFEADGNNFYNVEIVDYH